MQLKTFDDAIDRSITVCFVRKNLCAHKYDRLFACVTVNTDNNRD